MPQFQHIGSFSPISIHVVLAPFVFFGSIVFAALIHFIIQSMLFVESVGVSTLIIKFVYVTFLFNWLSMVPVLFVEKDSVYKKMGCDCYDQERNALTWSGTRSLIAHPPCRLWSQMRGLSTAPLEERLLAIFAVDKVRRFGGVLEHPAHSFLWRCLHLPKPGSGCDGYGGFSIEVDQFAFGHKARKRTWLYIVGCKPEQLPFIPPVVGQPEYIISSLRKKVDGSRTIRPEIPKKERNSTPLPFATWLVQVVTICSLSFNK